MRLQHFLSRSGVSSRRHAEHFIRAGRVQVNNAIIRNPAHSVEPDQDTVLLDGHPLTLAKPSIYLFFKPPQVVSTLSDPQGRCCVGDYVKKLSFRVYPVGRLDYDVFGLLLLTNDGELANALLHPRYAVPRTYWALLKGQLTVKDISALKRGVLLEGVKLRANELRVLPVSKRCRQLLGSPAQGECVVELVVAEGRKHLVKKLFRAVGCPVKKLARVAFGPFRLGNLRPGEIRQVSTFCPGSQKLTSSRRFPTKKLQ